MNHHAVARNVAVGCCLLLAACGNTPPKAPAVSAAELAAQPKLGRVQAERLAVDMLGTSVVVPDHLGLVFRGAEVTPMGVQGRWQVTVPSFAHSAGKVFTCVYSFTEGPVEIKRNGKPGAESYALSLRPGNEYGCYHREWYSLQDAKNFARAFTALQDRAHGSPETAAQAIAEDARFEQIASDYRSREAKPVLPEEARRHKIRAEVAINAKRFEEAVAAYGVALEVAPWWPEGHYNSAIILGELQDYDRAVRSMKRYLALVPGAADARASQDRIYRWEALAAQ